MLAHSAASKFRHRSMVHEGGGRGHSGCRQHVEKLRCRKSQRTDAACRPRVRRSDVVDSVDGDGGDEERLREQDWLYFNQQQ